MSMWVLLLIFCDVRFIIPHLHCVSSYGYLSSTRPGFLAWCQILGTSLNAVADIGTEGEGGKAMQATAPANILGCTAIRPSPQRPYFIRLFTVVKILYCHRRLCGFCIGLNPQCTFEDCMRERIEGVAPRRKDIYLNLLRCEKLIYVMNWRPTRMSVT
jgi:hypothetical protein